MGPAYEVATSFDFEAVAAEDGHAHALWANEADHLQSQLNAIEAPLGAAIETFATCPPWRKIRADGSLSKFHWQLFPAQVAQLGSTRSHGAWMWPYRGLTPGNTLHAQGGGTERLDKVETAAIAFEPTERGPVTISTELPVGGGPFASTPPVETEVDAFACQAGILL